MQYRCGAEVAVDKKIAISMRKLMATEEGIGKTHVGCNICFKCSRYGHNKEVCIEGAEAEEAKVNNESNTESRGVNIGKNQKTNDKDSALSKDGQHQRRNEVNDVNVDEDSEDVDSIDNKIRTKVLTEISNTLDIGSKHVSITRAYCLGIIKEARKKTERRNNLRSSTKRPTPKTSMRWWRRIVLKIMKRRWRIQESYNNYIRTLRIGYGEDNIIWRGNGGRFSVKNAYDIASDVENVEDCHWKFIWKLKLPPKLRHFLWLVFQGKLLTNLQRYVRGLTSDDACPCCHENVEDLNHLFRDCYAAKVVWNEVWRGCWNTIEFSAVMLRCPFKHYTTINLLTTSYYKIPT
ncbi:hypothetical protein ACOSQ2_021733 [Xanthoceras sorbifolium]